MIPITPMFEANFLTTAKNYWFGGNKPKTPSEEPSDTRQRIMTAAKKSIGKDEGGVGRSLSNVLNRRDLLAKAYGD